MILNRSLHPIHCSDGLSKSTLLFKTCCHKLDSYIVLTEIICKISIRKHMNLGFMECFLTCFQYITLVLSQ